MRREAASTRVVPRVTLVPVGRGLFVAPPAPDFTGAALLAEILRQRMLEFTFEGQRFYDLKRYGLTITKTNPAVTLPATDFKILPRIPTTEVDGNPNMVQNFGY